MRIAVWHNLGSGGGKRALYNHVKALKVSGHYLEAWTTDINTPSYLPLNDLIIEHRKPLLRSFIKNNSLNNPLKREQRNIQLFEEHALECVKEINEIGFDILFAASCGFSYMPYISIYADIPKVVYLGEPFRWHHEAIPENPWIAPYNSIRIKKIKRLYFDYLINYAKRLRVKKEIEAAKAFDRILVNSLYSRESVLRAYGLESNVCYLGLDDSVFYKKLNIKGNYVIGMGTISRTKGLHRAIEIVGSLPEEIRPELKWIANGTDNTYEKEVVLLALNHNVRLTFFKDITDEELKQLLSGAIVMIYASVLEPFGLAPLEANACGTYVVGIAEGGIRESIVDGENGSLVKGYRVNELRNLIINFVLNPDYATKMGNKAQEFVKQNWNSAFMKKNILRELNEIAINL